MTTPEEAAREKIDEQLYQSGWVVQSSDGMDLAALSRLSHTFCSVGIDLRLR
jgi:hypothetical protein